MVNDPPRTPFGMKECHCIIDVFRYHIDFSCGRQRLAIWDERFQAREMYHSPYILSWDCQLVIMASVLSPIL